MIYKPNFEEAKVYWRAFWEREVVDRPLICAKAPKDNMKIPPFSRSAATCFRACTEGSFDTLLKQFDMCAAATYYAGEAIPVFEITLGPDQYAGFLGARIETSDENQTTWAHPFVEDWSGFKAEIDTAPGGYFDAVKKCFEYGAAFAENRFLLATLDLHSQMDALSALRGPMGLCYDIMDCPQQVHKALDGVRRTYPAVFNMFCEAGDMMRRGFTSWAPLWCEERFTVVSCDFSCMLSPRQSREFVMPAVLEEVSFLDHALYHIDGEGALPHLDDILAVERIDAIQWVPGEGRRRSIEWMELLHIIQDAGKGLWICDWTAEEIKMHFKELKPEGLVFTVGTGSEREADELIRYVKRHM